MVNWTGELIRVLKKDNMIFSQVAFDVAHLPDKTSSASQIVLAAELSY